MCLIIAAAVQMSGCGNAGRDFSESSAKSIFSSTTKQDDAALSPPVTESASPKTNSDAVSAAERAASGPANSDSTIPEDPNQDFAFLSSEEVCALPAGTVLSGEQIDRNNVGIYFTSSEITEGDAVYARINGKSWRENPDIALSDLRYLRTLIVNFDGSTETGEMIVNAAIADDVLAVFQQLYNDGYEIRKMHLVDDYWTGDGASTDEASMQDDNTSAFNYRMTTSGRSLSNHALGHAIDVNPLENPYIYTSGDGSISVSPANATNIYDRSGSHVITEADVAYALFTAYGFTWGGSWNNPKDYQHFEK